MFKTFVLNKGFGADLLNSEPGAGPGPDGRRIGSLIGEVDNAILGKQVKPFPGNLKIKEVISEIMLELQINLNHFYR